MLLLLACQPVTIAPPDADPEILPAADTSADHGADSDPPPADDEFLSWRVHDTIGSLLYVSWEQADAGSGHVEYSFDQDVWLSTPERSFSPGSQEELLLGIPYDTEVEIRLVNDAETSESIEAETEDHPGGLPLAEYVSGDPARWLPEGQYLYTSINGSTGGWTGGTYWQVILDRQARVVWAMETPNNHWTI